MGTSIDNILFSGSDWKAIDPHGYVGDPAAEVGSMIRNAMECLPSKPLISKVLDRRLKILAEGLPFEPQRMQSWAFCLTVLSAAWSIEGHGRLAKFEVEVATILNELGINKF